MAKSGERGGRRGYVWMLVPRQKDVDYLRGRISKKGPLWEGWEYRLHRDAILIYDVALPLRDGEPDRFKRLRIVPVHPDGPFQLQYMRHTGQWWPVWDARGTIERMAELIETLPQCRPMFQLDWERQQK